MTPPALQRLSGVLLTLALSLAGGPAAADDDYGYRDHSGSLVPAYFLEIPESVVTLLVADASNASLLQFSHSGSDIAYRQQRYLSVGLQGVGKERRGDRRTPLGVYFLTDELDTRRLDPKYGAAAFVMDYPNTWDRRLARTGHGIWLHGVHPDTPIRPPRDTDGCLALPNEALLDLRPALTMHSTPVIVTRQVEWVEPGELAAERDALRARLSDWRRALESGDLHGYMALYHEDFEARDMNKREWARFRMESFSAAPASAVRVADLLLMRDPEEQDLYLARFRQTTERPGGAVSTWKRLYWRRTADGFRVITEDAG